MWNLRFYGRGRDLRIKSGLCILRRHSGPGELADLGSARLDKKAEGIEGKEASRQAMVLILALRASRK